MYPFCLKSKTSFIKIFICENLITLIFTIPNIVFVILIGISTAYLTFLTTKGGLTDNKFSNVLKKLTYRGRLVLSVLFFILFLLISQELNNQNINHNKDLILTKERNQRDEFIKRGIDSSTQVLFKSLSFAFAKQGLKIDTLKNTVVNLKDSIKTTINYSTLEYPVLQIDSNTIYRKKINGEEIFRIGFKSWDAGTTDIKIKTSILITYNDSTTNLLNYRLFPKNLTIPKNGMWTANLPVEKIQNINNIYIYVKGDYKNLDKTKIFSIDNLYKYTNRFERTSTLYGIHREVVLKKIQDLN